ncbi:hypothetical protein JCGZ_19363 [Jatropha curcas]|uniref:Uncharacterized protein n=1 Tax=Jatropha curcas TaxID=180498 RepID=A0A067K1K8_JATCU|nr:hypothetical protein JCGZ_19363 [Jatropha curcas]
MPVPGQRLARPSRAVQHARARKPPHSLTSTVWPCHEALGARDDSFKDEEAEDTGDANMEEGNPTPFVPSSGADRFQSIEIMHGSLDSRMDTLQGQLQTLIQLLQPHPPPPPES